MPCTPLTLPGGARGFICSRTPRPRCNCGKPSAYQCDAPAPQRRSHTCDKHLCASCATEVGPDQHLCRDHAAQCVQLPPAQPLQEELF